MNRLSCALAIFFISTGAHAAQQLSYNGHFISGSGSISAGDTFSGQYNFNPELPDLSAYQASPYSRIEMTYLNDQSSSTEVNGGQSIIGNNKIELHLVDNQLLSQSMIDQIGLTGAVQSGVYDTADLSDAHWSGVDNTSYYFMALFAANTFSSTDIQNQNYQGILGQDLHPLYTVYRILQQTNGVIDFSGAGIVDQASISAVPLPGAAWLFGSVLASLVIPLRKRK
jgi:hypothetical protein